MALSRVDPAEARRQGPPPTSLGRRAHRPSGHFHVHLRTSYVRPSSPRIARPAQRTSKRKFVETEPPPTRIGVTWRRARPPAQAARHLSNVLVPQHAVGRLHRVTQWQPHRTYERREAFAGVLLRRARWHATRATSPASTQRPLSSHVSPSTSFPTLRCKRQAKGGPSRPLALARLSVHLSVAVPSPSRAPVQ